MKHIGFILLVGAMFCGTLGAQTPEKKPEETKSTGAKSDSSKAGVQKTDPPKSTRMAITQKGVPTGKPKTNDAAKTSSNTPKSKAASGQSK